MDAVLGVALLWGLFGATHVGLATRRVRGALVDRLGEWRFTLLYFAVAGPAFAAVCSFYAAHRFEGPAGLALGSAPVLGWLGIAAIVIGVALMVAGLADYPRSPMAYPEAMPKPVQGIERVTRHAFFAGLTIFAVAHAVLATRLVGAVFSLGFAAVCAVGARHQDAKLAARKGIAYEQYLAETSAVPFAAILGGRQRLVLWELPWVALGVGVALAWVLRLVHGSIFEFGGAWVYGLTFGGALLALIQSRHQMQAAGRGVAREGVR